jgi:di/tricarboxylate transporter
MSLAVISVAALVTAVVVSCVSRLNVGVLAIALAWIVGVYIGGLPVNTVMSGFPSQLCLTLIGVTLLFALAQANGTLERIAHRAVRICRGNCGTIPVMFFVLGAALSSM